MSNCYGPTYGECEQTFPPVGTRRTPYYETAYDIAVRHGFRGTERSWLQSLRGEPGSSATGVIVVTDAVGDGLADDTVAIQTAIDDAGIDQTIALEAGKTYLVTDTLKLKDGMTFEGNGATILWHGDSVYEDGRWTSKPIMYVSGSLGEEIPILDKPKCIGAPISTETGAENERGFTVIKVGTDPDLVTGDRIILQAARNALSQESGAYWCGTPTGTVAPAWWAEVLIVNDLKKTGAEEWTVRCVGGLIYPYYLPDPTAEDNSVELEAVYVDEDGYVADTGKLFGYQIKGGGSALHRAHSTIRKADFVRNVTIRDLTIHADGVAHIGDRSEPDTWKADQEANTIRLALCEGALLDNICVIKTDAGRGFLMENCFHCTWRRCEVSNHYKLYDAAAVAVYDNVYTTVSCWYCTAQECVSVRAGQSFDSTYTTNGVRCPDLYLSILDCTVLESISSAATTHSGCYGTTFENCRFIGCAAPMLIRSPLTTVRGCSFAGSFGDSADAGYPGEWDPNADSHHIQIGEPTVQGCVVEGCTFTGGKGVRISPYLIRFFNYNKGDYITYTEVGSKLKPSGNPYGPECKTLGVRISGNVFKGANMALWVTRAHLWCTASNGTLTDYAKEDMGVDFTDNVIIECGRNYFPVYLDNLVNGVTIRGNRFIRCVSESPAYYSNGVAKTIPYLITVGGSNVRIAIVDNSVSECGGGFQYLYNAMDTVRTDLGTNGVAEFLCHGNRVDRRVSGGTDMAIAPGDADVERSFAQPGKTVAERVIDSVDAGSSGMGTGMRYDFEASSVALMTLGKERLKVTDESAYCPYTSGVTPTCLLHSWTYGSAPEGAETYTVRFRIAVYRVTGGKPVTQEMYEKVADCWDAGVDAKGLSVDFSTSVWIDMSGEDEDPQLVQVPPPVNQVTTFARLDADATADADGTVTVQKASGVGLVYYDFPLVSGTTPMTYEEFLATVTQRERFTLFSEIKANDSASPLRVNTTGDTYPPFFQDDIRDRSMPIEPIISGHGIVTRVDLQYDPMKQLTLGAEDFPWKELFTDKVTIGETSLNEAQLQALLHLLE